MNLDFYRADGFTQKLNYELITKIVEPNSKILDLGCGNGELLQKLVKEKNAVGLGFEIDQQRVIEALQKGLSIIQGNMDVGLQQFDNDEFDYVILNQTLQSTVKPDFVLSEMLRIGKKVIISFPNFGFWKVRAYLLVNGRMPKSDELPFEWYNTPNIHLLTIFDFFDYCKKHNINISKSIYMRNQTAPKTLQCKTLANLFADEAIFIITKDII